MIEENLYQFLNDFGKEISFTLADGTILNKNANGDSLIGIFDTSYCNSEMGYTTIIADNPTLTCVYNDIKKVEKGNICIIDDVKYTVFKKPQIDGTGFAKITLSDK